MRVENLKYLNLIINSRKVPNDSKIKQNDLKKGKTENCKESDIEKKKIKAILAITLTTEKIFGEFYSNFTS